MSLPAYKHYQRRPRAVYPEENYGKGMMWTNSPLPDGYCKHLLNLDLKDNGEYLSPRPAFKAIEFYSYADAPTEAYTDTQFLSASKDCIEENDSTLYKQIIVGDAHSKSLFALTGTDAALAAIPALPLPVKTLKIKKLTTSAKMQIPTSPQIHGLTVASASKIVRHIGTFGFNNSYYFFDNTGLKQTKLNTETHQYEAEAITPRTLTPAEAVMWGYNMLCSKPYTFSNDIKDTATPIQLLGLLPYDSSGNLVLAPKVNQVVQFECFFIGQKTKTYNVKWEWREAGTNDWITIKSGEITLADNTQLVCDFAVPAKEIIVRVTAENTELSTDLQVIACGFDFTPKALTANAESKTYDLKSATAMAFWKQRLVVAIDNLLFVGEVNDPSYFPYPNNVEVFTEPIIHVIPLLDQLVVFTTSKLHIITLNQDGLTWTVKFIQGNLEIKEHDIHLMLTVKNMLFFKSGNYYYMIVPKAGSLTGELTIAPISKPIEYLLDHFEESIKDILFKLYEYEGDLTLIHYYNYLDFEDVHNVYTFTLAGDNYAGRYLNVCLLYNTVSRTWRMYLYESQHIITPYKPDATKKGTFMGLVPYNDYPCVQFLKFGITNGLDSYVGPDGALVEPILKNYQALDTGYRDLLSDFKKRFREAQLKINNTAKETLHFQTEFYIDGDTRRSMFRYEPIQEVDPTNPDFGVLTLERIPLDTVIVPGTTMLAEDSSQVNRWMLDYSRFPDVSVWKVRVPFSGKGYSPRMLFVSFNFESYEILNHIWVFRELYAR